MSEHKFHCKTCGRDHAPCVDLLAERDRLKAQRDRLLVALKDVEWTWDDGYLQCPTCGNLKKTGHTVDCKLTAAIAEAERP